MYLLELDLENKLIGRDLQCSPQIPHCKWRCRAASQARQAALTNPCSKRASTAQTSSGSPEGVGRLQAFENACMTFSTLKADCTLHNWLALHSCLPTEDSAACSFATDCQQDNDLRLLGSSSAGILKTAGAARALSTMGPWGRFVDNISAK
jgi:hypothetical protein